MLRDAVVSALAVLAVATCLAPTGETHTPNRQPAAYRLAELRRQNLQREVSAAWIWTSCERRDEKGYGQCGRVSDRFGSEEFWDQLEAKHCQGLSSKACDDAVSAAIVTLFVDRYFAATVDAVVKRCQQAPDECEGTKFEDLFRRNHNENLRAYYVKASHQIDMEREQESRLAAREAREREAAEQKRRRDVLHAIGLGLAAMGESFSESSDPQPSQRRPTSATSSHPRELKDSSRSCTSDVGCGVGQRCVKGYAQVSGVCAKAVDKHGIPTHDVPSTRIDSGKGTCTGVTDCPVGFRCDKSLGGLKGHCVKL